MSDPVAYVYGLIDPRFDKVRYIGKTCNLSARLGKHRTQPDTKWPVGRWVSKLQLVGLRFSFVVFAECHSHEEAFEIETRLIKAYRDFGQKIYNVTSGGEGIPGFKHSLKHKEKIRQALLGVKHSIERIAKNRNKTIPQEMRDRISRKLTGRKLSAEHVAKYKLRRNSSEVRVKIGEGLKRAYAEGRR